MTDLLNINSKNQLKKYAFELDERAVKVHTLEPRPTVTSEDVCQVKQYTHITKNGIQWNLNPSTVQVGVKYFKIDCPRLKKTWEHSPICT